MKLETGDAAPDFRLPDQDGTEHELSAYKGSWVLLYFYPKDSTPGCTKEACAIRDAIGRFEKAKAKVFGISVDPVKSHARFAGRYALPFRLLADEDKKVVNLYGVWGKKKFMGKEYDGTHRMSFLIDPEGKIARVYQKVKPEQHAQEVLEDLSGLASQAIGS